MTMLMGELPAILLLLLLLHHHHRHRGACGVFTGADVSCLGGQRTCSPAHPTGGRALHHELRHRRRHGGPRGDGGEDEVNQPGVGTAAHAGRPVRAGRRSQGGEPEVEVREPGPGSVHREPHVCLQRLPDHRHEEQTEVRYQR